jgi:hypothetical protein
LKGGHGLVMHLLGMMGQWGGEKALPSHCPNAWTPGGDLGCPVPMHLSQWGGSGGRRRKYIPQCHVPVANAAFPRVCPRQGDTASVFPSAMCQLQMLPSQGSAAGREAQRCRPSLWSEGSQAPPKELHSAGLCRHEWKMWDQPPAAPPTCRFGSPLGLAASICAKAFATQAAFSACAVTIGRKRCGRQGCRGGGRQLGALRMEH